MDRHSKVINFSLPPQLHAKLERLTTLTNSSRSELLRDMIEAYLQTGGDAANPRTVDGLDLANSLKAYWQLRSKLPLSIIVTGLVIATNDSGRVLIGSRALPDDHVPNLTWSFPGSRLKTLDFDSEVTQNFHSRTGLHVSLGGLVAARIIPEANREDTQVVALYFSGHIAGKQVGSPQKPYNELKWVKPLEVFQYFTSSTTDEVTRYLSQITASRSG